MHGDTGWFASDTGAVLMSHGGLAAKRCDSSTMDAFVAAYEKGYRWFQVDAVRRDGQLVAYHSALGRAIALRPAARRRLAAAVPLGCLLRSPSLAGARWNIEVRSSQTCDMLLALLDSMTADERSNVMISAPFHGSILRKVAGRWPEVALAAPVWHGGGCGIRFSTPGRANIDGREYDCQQVYHRLIRSKARTANRPLRQAWTIRNNKAFHRAVDRGVSATIEASCIELPWREPSGRITSQRPREFPQVSALALGGGGWRSAFGAIGAVMYLSHQCEQRTAKYGISDGWGAVRQVVGVSGGSFAVAALATEDIDDSDPATPLQRLIGQLERAGGDVAGVVRSVGLVVGLLFAAACALGAIAWTQRLVVAAILLALVVAGLSFLVRLTIGQLTRSVVTRVFGDARMRALHSSPPDDRERCYRIGATGLNDGNGYAFTTHAQHDRLRRAEELDHSTRTEVPFALEHFHLADAVARSTFLPFLGQTGRRRLYLCSPHESSAHTDSCSVPDRLADGGMASIFGRRLVEPAAPTPAGADLPVLLVVDGGRGLRIDRGRSTADLAHHLLERLSAVYHLARWLQVSFEIAYRADLQRVADHQPSDGYECRLVRLAENEVVPKPVDGEPKWEISQRRQDDLNRLILLRDRVHSFSLLRAGRQNIDRGIAVAVAACALEFEEEPDIPHLLEEIGGALGRSDRLASLWTMIPVMGVPVAPHPGASSPVSGERVLVSA
ncbi:MAG: hypothetical protein ABW195_00535 [Ilumatobacteraceae bacterium]